MLTVSPGFLDAIRGPHNLKVIATAQTPDGRSVDLPVMDGTVTIDRTANQRRTLDLQISDPLLYPDEPTDIVAPYGTEILVSRGIRLANESIELAALGVFRVQDASRDQPAGSLHITGWDRSAQVADERFTSPRRFNAMAATDLIIQLVTEVFPDAVFNLNTSDPGTIIPKHSVDRDRWAEVIRLGQVIGCEVFPDAYGEWTIQDVPDPTTASPVWAIDAGPNGVLVKNSNTVTREGAPNGVVAIGENGNGNQPPVQYLATDDDPSSPTMWGGPYGHVPRFYSSSFITTLAQAQRVAQAQLADHLGVTRTVSFEAVPNPALDAGDAIQIVYPNGVTELHIVDALTIPLSTSGTMTGQTRAVDWTAQ